SGVEGVDMRPDFSPPLPFDEASFDLVICHDLTDRLEEKPQWAREIRRILDPNGHLVVAVATESGQFISELAGLKGRSALGYEDAYAQLSEAFGEVAIYGQAPVAATMFFDLQSEEEEPGLTFDASLLDEDGEDPGWYILVFG